MRHGHVAVQGRAANDGIEGESEVCDVEDDGLRAVVLRRSKGNGESDAAIGYDNIMADPTEWSRWSQLRHGNLQGLKGMQTHGTEPGAAVNQHMVHLDVGDGGGDHHG